MENKGINVQQADTEVKEDKKKINWKKELISWAILIASAFVLAYIITHFIIIKADIPSQSMVATINKGDKIVGNRLAYLFGDPERKDIIIFSFPDDETLTYIKRIIGLPGEKVEIIDGKVYINDSETPLDEPYLYEEMIGSFGPYYVPEDCYFVMGDNRNISKDARYWDNKFVEKSKIDAKTWFRYSPSLDGIE